MASEDETPDACCTDTTIADSIDDETLGAASTDEVNTDDSQAITIAVVEDNVSSATSADSTVTNTTDNDAPVALAAADTTNQTNSNTCTANGSDSVDIADSSGCGDSDLVAKLMLEMRDMKVQLDRKILANKQHRDREVAELMEAQRSPPESRHSLSGVQAIAITTNMGRYAPSVSHDEDSTTPPPKSGQSANRETYRDQSPVAPNGTGRSHTLRIPPTCTHFLLGDSNLGNIAKKRRDRSGATKIRTLRGTTTQRLTTIVTDSGTHPSVKKVVLNVGTNDWKSALWERQQNPVASYAAAVKGKRMSSPQASPHTIGETSQPTQQPLSPRSQHPPPPPMSQQPPQDAVTLHSPQQQYETECSPAITPSTSMYRTSTAIAPSTTTYRSSPANRPGQLRPQRWPQVVPSSHTTGGFIPSQFLTPMGIFTRRLDPTTTSINPIIPLICSTRLCTVPSAPLQKLLELGRLQQRYNTGEIDRKEYVKSMAWKNLPAML
ncbi:uncharacterized protein [Littorina saxatilis]|uniref:uncharacterized protein n=1 Tax=Littorina saxatilis TaxID=31220 RepID=UPI0038B518B0